ncbi:MAG: hypothetical protein NC212_08440 [Staphylococcus sp.]|nr:hypothetical protein [Staphylococcus sp.]
MPESNQVKSKRDLAVERMKTKHPDRSFDDDESLFGQFYDDYDDYDRQISESSKRIEDLEGRQKAFSDMFTSDPRSARLMMDWKNGGDPAMSLIRIYGDDILDAINDPEKQEVLAEARKEFADKLSKEKEYSDLYDKNLPKSLKELERYASEKGVPDEKIDEAMETLATITKDFMLGKITSATIDLMLKAVNYDADVEAAAQEGEVAGRNAKIEEKLRKSKKGDGTAQISGKNGDAPEAKPKRDLGALDRYDGRGNSIFDRGNEKRIQRH